MKREPEPAETTRVLAAGIALWCLFAVVTIGFPNVSSPRGSAVAYATTQICFWGGVVFLSLGLALRAAGWLHRWATTPAVSAPASVISETPGFLGGDEDYDVDGT